MTAVAKNGNAKQIPTTMPIKNAAVKTRLEHLNNYQQKYQSRKNAHQRLGSFDVKKKAHPSKGGFVNKKRYSLAAGGQSALDTVDKERRAHREHLKQQAQQQMKKNMQSMKNGIDFVISEDTTSDPQLPLSPMAGREKPPDTNSAAQIHNHAQAPTAAKPNAVVAKPTKDDHKTNEQVVSSPDTPEVHKSSWKDHIPFIGHRKRNQKPKKVVYQLKKGEKFELFSHLKPTKILGEGAYAAVCEVVDQRTKKKYACKKNRDVFSNINDARRILREIKLMIHFDHPHVMSLCGVVPPDPHEREDFKHVYLIMPRMDTTLSKVIRSQQDLSERHIQYFVYQMMRGLEYMHSGGVIHRDLKPENILVNAGDCKLKITDFGLARGVISEENTPNKLTEYVVTRWYRAPEVMCCSRLYSSQIDTWALGCIVAEMYTRRPLFKGRNHIEQLQLIFHYMGTPEDLTWIKTPDAKKWISQMKKRPPKKMSSVLPKSTPLVQDFVSQLLIVDPDKRPTVTDALKHDWLKEFYREKDYKDCPVFNISFEFESSVKTAFGVRHMMYEELTNFYEKNQRKKARPKQKQRVHSRQNSNANANQQKQPNAGV